MEPSGWASTLTTASMLAQSASARGSSGVSLAATLARIASRLMVESSVTPSVCCSPAGEKIAANDPVFWALLQAQSWVRVSSTPAVAASSATVPPGSATMPCSVTGGENKGVGVASRFAASSVDIGGMVQRSGDGVKGAANEFAASDVTDAAGVASCASAGVPMSRATPRADSAQINRTCFMSSSSIIQSSLQILLTAYHRGAFDSFFTHQD